MSEMYSEMIIMSLWKYIWKTISELGYDREARCEQKAYIYRSIIHNSIDLFGPCLIIMWAKHLLDFICSLMGEHKEKERSCKKKDYW